MIIIMIIIALQSSHYNKKDDITSNFCGHNESQREANSSAGDSIAIYRSALRASLPKDIKARSAPVNTSLSNQLTWRST